MGAKGVLRTVEGNHVLFFCPGCQEAHIVCVPPHPQAWGFNGDFDKPTFTPSVLLWRDPNPNAAPASNDTGKPTAATPSSGTAASNSSTTARIPSRDRQSTSSPSESSAPFKSHQAWVPRRLGGRAI